MTQESLSSYLILASYKKQVDKRKLVKVANQFCFKNEHRFSIEEQISICSSMEKRKEVLPKVLLREPKHRISGGV